MRRLQKLEEQAKRLQDRLADVREKWEAQKRKLELSGERINYDFGDVLA